MELIAWDETYSVAIEEIDREHQQLFALFNELYRALQDGHGQEVVGHVLEGVSEYTGYHFAHEERLFREHGYAEGTAHTAEHARLTELTRTLVHKFEAGEPHVSIATLKLLSNWLGEHVLRSDKRFASFLLAKGMD